MSTKYKFRDNDKVFFISFAVVFWIDIFIRNEYKEILLDCFRVSQREKGLEIYSWIIMPSHVHMIIGSSIRPMDKIIGEMKNYSSRKLREALQDNPRESRKEWILMLMSKAGHLNGNNNHWQFWQQYNHPIMLFEPEIYYQKLLYIHLNPVKAGFVEREEDWLYSSARDFHGKKGLIDLCYAV